MVDGVRLLAMLNDLERRLDVASWFVDDLPLWPLMRSQLGWTSQRRAGDAAGDAGLRHRLKRAVSMVAPLRAGAPTGADGHADVVVLTNDTARVTLDDRPYDRHAGPILEACDELGVQGVAWSPGAEPLPQPAMVSVRRDVAVAQLVGLRRQFVLGRPAGVEHTAVQAFKVASAPDLTSLLSEATLRRHVGIVQTLAATFERRLARVGPRLVVVVGMDVNTFAMCLAARRLAIPSVELQHGLFGPAHFSYANWAAVPPGGYAVLPDTFWVWGASDAQTIARWSGATGCHQPVVGGNVWLRRWMDAEPVRPVVEGTRRLLVTLQPGLPGLDLLARCAASCHSMGVEVVLRPHPRLLPDEWERAQSALQDSSPALDDPKRPIFEALRLSSAHLTHSSATVSEASQIGVPSLLVSATGPADFPSEHEVGIAATLHTAAEIDKMVSDLLDRGAVPPLSAPPPTVSVLGPLLLKER